MRCLGLDPAVQRSHRERQAGRHHGFLHGWTRTGVYQSFLDAKRWRERVGSVVDDPASRAIRRFGTRDSRESTRSKCPIETCSPPAWLEVGHATGCAMCSQRCHLPRVRRVCCGARAKVQAEGVRGRVRVRQWARDRSWIKVSASHKTRRG